MKILLLPYDSASSSDTNTSAEEGELTFERLVDELQGVCDKLRQLSVEV